MGDVLFATIEKFHAGRSWGRFLDAGTGLHSIKWVQRIPTTAWTAITADGGMKTSIEKDSDFSKKMRPTDSLVVGNWMNDAFVQSLGKYDTILADYLIGAVDGFSPYEQDVILTRLKRQLNPNGRLYFIGMNPVPDNPPPPAPIISEIRQARDACILLAGHRPYREFPLSWMKRHLSAAGLTITGSKNFTILHSEESAVRQIRVAQSKLVLMKHADMRSGMDLYLRDLEQRTRAAIRAAGGKIPLSFDYVLSVEHSESAVTADIAVTDATDTATDTAADTAAADNAVSASAAPAAADRGAATTTSCSRNTDSPTRSQPMDECAPDSAVKNSNNIGGNSSNSSSSSSNGGVGIEATSAVPSQQDSRIDSTMGSVSYSVANSSSSSTSDATAGNSALGTSCFGGSATHISNDVIDINRI